MVSHRCSPRLHTVSTHCKTPPAPSLICRTRTTQDGIDHQGVCASLGHHRVTRNSGSARNPEKLPQKLVRRGGGVVDRTALEMRHTRKGIGGSNPSLSAISALNFIDNFTDFLSRPNNRPNVCAGFRRVDANEGGQPTAAVWLPPRFSR